MVAQKSHRFAIRTGAAALALLLVSALPASADVLVLRSGDRLTGTIIDRDAVALDAKAQPTIAIAPTYGGPNLEFDLEEVASIGLEYDGSVREIVLFAREPMPNTPRNLISGLREAPDSMKLILGGMAVGAVGMSVKFGGHETDEFGEPIPGGGKTYNQTNDVLKLAGATMIIMGVALSIEEGPRKTDDDIGVGADIGVGCSPISGSPAVEVCVRF